MEKIKLFIKNYLESDQGKDVLVVIIVILVGLISFQLGRLSKNNDLSGIKIEYSNQEAKAITAYQANIDKKDSINNSNIKNFFASNRGKKYYSIGCSAGKTIKEENRIYFNTEAEAEKAGYIKSTSCN